MLLLLPVTFWTLCLVLFPFVGVLSAPSTARCFPSSFLFGATFDKYNVSGHGSSTQSTNRFGCSPLDVTKDDLIRRFSQEGHLMSDLGLSSVQFSISWTRVMRWNAATGRMERNPQGLALYRVLLDDLQAQGLEPIVTLYESTLPSALQTSLVEPTGWLNPVIVAHFGDFAQLVFEEFGRHVKYWATFNEPWTFIKNGDYSYENLSNGVNSSDTDANEVVVHHVLLAHARAVTSFRDLKRRDASVVAAGARIGMILNAGRGHLVDEPTIPFSLDWFLTPLVTGGFSESMRRRAGDRQLPQFSLEEAALVKGSYDVMMFNGFNLQRGRAGERGIDDTLASSGASLSSTTSTKLLDLDGHLDDYFNTIKWLHEKDPLMEILLTDNGSCASGESSTLDQLHFFQSLVERVYEAIVEDEIPIIGFPAWPFAAINDRDSCKLHSTSSSTKGLHHFPCPAARWLTHLFTTKCLDGWENETMAMDISIEEKEASHGNVQDLETDGKDVVVPLSLREVAVLIVIGMVILVAISCEVMRELHLSSQGLPEELQVLITIED
uniref:RxLR effector candidate protein n=1 Tax=Hyaloperonospora arabidopsidis (strain Emoy2) TaxID=559515 RepID=M4BN31_HYAAE